MKGSQNILWSLIWKVVWKWFPWQPHRRVDQRINVWKTALLFFFLWSLRPPAYSGSRGGARGQTSACSSEAWLRRWSAPWCQLPGTGSEGCAGCGAQLASPPWAQCHPARWQPALQCVSGPVNARHWRGCADDPISTFARVLWKKNTLCGWTVQLKVKQGSLWVLPLWKVVWNALAGLEMNIRAWMSIVHWGSPCALWKNEWWHMRGPEVRREIEVRADMTSS